MQKIFFFDIDETIAKGQFIPEENKAMLVNLCELGHFTFICTGRPIAYAKNLFGNLVDGYITNNGRQVYYYDHLILDKPIEQNDLLRYQYYCNLLHCDYAFIGTTKDYVSNVSDEVSTKMNQLDHQDDFLLVTLTQGQFKSMFLIFIIKIKSILKELRNNLKMRFYLMIILVYLLQMPRHSIMIKEMELLFYLIIFLLIKATVIPLEMEIMI